jgi:hypothetical protein
MLRFPAANIPTEASRIIRVIFTLAIEIAFDIHVKPAEEDAAWFSLGVTPD